MTPEILMIRVLQHAKRTLAENGKPDPTPEQLEAQGRWLFSLYAAQDLHEMTWKDMAEMVMDGVPKTGSVHEECSALADDAELTDLFLDFCENL